MDLSYTPLTTRLDAILFILFIDDSSNINSFCAEVFLE